MKVSKDKIKEFILQEVKKISIEEGWSLCKSTISESFVPNIDSEEEVKVDIEEVKMLAEEFKRMKELVDFRRPLLGNQ